MAESRVLLLEPFYGGSHKQLTDFIYNAMPNHRSCHEITKVVMSDKKWHWRMRTSALYFAERIPHLSYSSLFISSVGNLAELLGLRPDLLSAYKILYFHENQLIYPVRKQQERDFQYGYNQILSCLVADVILFNSNYNMQSFLSSINSYMKLVPDYQPKNLVERIQPKCRVLYFPLHVSHELHNMNDNPCLHIVWPHRWEHDKNPEEFFDVLLKLKDGKLQFYVSVLGQSYSDAPDIFAKAKNELSECIVNWGYQDTKEDYVKVLKTADVVVSTANHEFFGVSMLEAVMCGCYPLCPNRLVYPEIFPSEYLYNTKQQLYKKLRNFCNRPDLLRKHEVKVNISRFDGELLREEYIRYLLHEKTL